MPKNSELIYTSAPKGLRPGSSGFCTVAMSEGMPAGLVGPLENLSAYRHHESDGPSPVNFMHVQMKVAGRPINVLSRIAEAPPDYTGRTNKIAHHIVVATADRAAGGPAAVLRQPGFAIETWNGEVRKMPEPKTIPPADSPPRIAQIWAEQSGDAGWAGTVASIFGSQTPGTPLYLIYRPEQNAELLALVDEAICLLPESKRWNATFSTYAGELPPGVSCRLRCLIAGSPEALSLPPSAMTLDLASGNLGTPPPGPLVDAARSGRLAPPETVRSAAVPAGSSRAQTEFPEPTIQAAASHADGPEFPLPPPHPMPGTLPPQLQPKTSSSRNHAWTLLAVAAVLVFCLGGGGAFYFLQSDLLADRNASAGIKSLPEANVSSKVKPEPNDVLEPEPDIKPDAVAEAEADAMDAGRKEVDGKTQQPLQMLEELAKKILAGEDFLSDDHDQSVIKFSDKVKNEWQVLAKQNKQLKEFSLEPTTQQLAAWVRSEDGMESLNGFIDTRKEDIDTLKPDSPFKDLQDQRKVLADALKAWNDEATKWEHEQKNQPDLILEIPNNFTVDQTIKRVRATAKDRLEKSMSSLLAQYEELSIENNQIAASIEEKLEPQQEELAKAFKRRRDSHRLLIHFDGDSRRKEKRLQIKPRCVIRVNSEDFKAIDRLEVDDGKRISLSQSGDEVKLTGKFDGWLTVTLGDSKIILKFNLNQKNIPPAVSKQFPILKQLDQFVEQQDKTFDSGGSLRNAFNANRDEAESGIRHWLDEDKENKGKKNEDKEKRNVEAAKWREAINKMKEVVNQSPKSKLNELYVKQTDQTVKDLQSLKVNITDAFREFVTLDVAIEGKIDDHIKNLETLRGNYTELMKNNGLLDFKGKLVFGSSSESSSESSSGNNHGQLTFERIKEFELFFFPELVYGPPPKE